MCSEPRAWTTPRDADLGLSWIENDVGLAIGVMPNACLFAIEHRDPRGTVSINQVLGSPIGGGIGRLVLRILAPEPVGFEIVGPRAEIGFGASRDCFVWEGETQGLRHRVTLVLQPDDAAWVWWVDVENKGTAARKIDAILVQDIGLGERGFLMNNEAYASQYTDHHVTWHDRCGPIVMNRQNLAQNGRHPWVLHACLEEGRGYATDGLQLFGPAFRGTDRPLFLTEPRLPSEKLQHEQACVAIQSVPVELAPGARASCRFLGLFDPDHADPSSDADISRITNLRIRDRPDVPVSTAKPVQSYVQTAPVAEADRLEVRELVQLYSDRILDEHADGRLLSFFVPGSPHNRHVVLRDKERLVARRHGTLLRSGRSMLPDESTLCATCWMHGLFGAQLTIGNTSFHKLFSVSRDAYDTTRTGGLRILIDLGDGWSLLDVPSAFEMGLSDCRWIYRFADRTVVVGAVASGDDAAMQWRVTVEGDPCRFLVYGHVVLGERELDHAGTIEVDEDTTSFRLMPDAESLWGRHYPFAACRLVTSTPDAIEAIGGDELLYPDGRTRGGAPGSARGSARGGAYIALRTKPTREFCFTVSGSLTDLSIADRLAEKYRRGIPDRQLLDSAAAYWLHVTRGARIRGGGADGVAFDTLLPWLVHNGMIHLTVPHGLEQYTGGAWGTRDVCQGPIELLLSLDHDAPVKDILRIVFAQQFETRGDWPQWFMLEPYSAIQDQTSHGDVIVWPLKASNDYIEATGDLAFLDEPVAWRREDTLERTTHKAPLGKHIEKLLATVRERFIPGTTLIRYGEGDWNDSLQPADPTLRDNMVSSWTVALLYQQLVRYAEIMRRTGHNGSAETTSKLAEAMRHDFNRYLVRDGTVAGYAIFGVDRDNPELVIHPSDTRTGLRYSLLPMTRSIIAGLFTPEQAEHHLGLIREHLLFPDGVRLIDRPIPYHGGVETTFKRAESAAYFGREIGLMYVHAHLRYAEAMAVTRDSTALLDALLVVDPVIVHDVVIGARPRQRNAYFTSSDAAFPDRASASAQWSRAKDGTIGFEGGWRIYSSGPGLYTNMLCRMLLGRRRAFGARITCPSLPPSRDDMRLEFDGSA